ncbi:PE-PPE domain-containing protein [Mycobacterium botniense]|uniref:PE-PPE domain-containing protein n=1 Tax=Mycobacterium botniense TaxID=84962 RepID=A0A7I9Y1X5_9MYCO|nr:PE-PPE domain-containing protein [Mycobacterium botniense]GFG76034.1 hypothetical protein MBOT_33990 [Mycobacterium botniense]
MMTPARALGDGTGFVMGGSGNPIPPPTYIDNVVDKFLVPGGYGSYTPEGLVTPEQLYPLTGVESLTLDQSVDEGVTILNNAITSQIPDGNVVIFGYSQSALIASLEMERLAASPTAPSPDQLAFVLIGDPMNPNGGLFERFDGLTFPTLGATLYGATPADVYPTTIYTIEYDGAADFPRYPIDLLADLNAAAGFYFLHPTYPDLTSAQLDSAIQLPTEGPTLTTYYMIPTENLPLLDPLREIPVVGKLLADLIQPDLTVLVNLGYGNPDYGWSQGPANVATPFALLPDVNPRTVVDDLVQGAQQGVQDAIAAVKSSAPPEPSMSDLSTLMTLDPLPALMHAVHTPASDWVISPETLASEITNVANTVSSVLSNDYATLLPTADLALALGITLPAYDANLFVDGLEQGSLLNAVGDPIAADLGLVSFGGFLELIAVNLAIDSTLNGVISVINDLLRLIP